MKNPLEIIKEEQEHQARMKEILNTPYSQTDDKERGKKDTEDWFSTKVLYPLSRLIAYLGKYHCEPPSKEVLRNASFPRLTSDEIFDVVETMSSSQIRQAMNLLNCSSQVIDALIDTTEKNNKAGFVTALNSENIDTFYISQFCTIYQNLSDMLELLECILSTFPGENIYDESAFEKAQSILEYMQSQKQCTKEALGISNELDEFFELSEKYYKTTDIEKKNKEIFRHIWLILLGMCLTHVNEISILDDFFKQYPLLAKWDKEFADEYLVQDTNYETCPDDICLERPDCIFEESLKEISDKYLDHQNFAYFFGYGEWEEEMPPKIIWRREWGELAYFIRALYTGYVRYDGIVFDGDLPNNTTERFQKIFVDLKGNSPQVSTLNSVKQKYANAVYPILKNILLKVGRKR